MRSARRTATFFLPFVVGVAVLAYLRDPGWLIDVHSGFGRWQQDRSGRRFRWTSGRASFFAPANARLVRLPLRAPFLREDRESLLVRIDVNDRPASVVALSDASWAEAEVKVPPSLGLGRRLVRLDLHVSRTWGARSLGVQVGEATVE